MIVLKKALFIDRDGTIIKDIPYSVDTGRIEIYHDAVDLMKRYSGEGYLIVIITNQSGINRGYFTVQELKIFNDVLIHYLQNMGVHIDAVYFCPHTPEENCRCRKPETGMVTAAATDLNIDIKTSVMAGDREDMDGGLAERLGMKFILMKHEQSE